MGQLRCESIQQKLEKIVPKYIARFIIWYKTPENKRCAFEDLMKYEAVMKGKTLDDCMEWLQREDAQEAMQMYLKHMKKYNLMKIYDAMFEKALQGDVNAAKWIESFSHSDFFDESTDDIEDFLKEVNIPALKGGGTNGTK
jgi:glutamyl-tRNA reductase